MLSTPSGRRELAYTWLRHEPSDRQVWRRRASCIVEAANL